MYLIKPLNRSPLNELAPFLKLNEERFTFHHQYKHSRMFANRKYQELSYPQNLKMCDPILVNPIVKMRPRPAAHPY